MSGRLPSSYLDKPAELLRPPNPSGPEWFLWAALGVCLLASFFLAWTMLEGFGVVGR